MTLRVAELESLFTANITPFEQGAQKVEARQRQLDGKAVNVLVDADSSNALQAMARVEATAQGLPDASLEVTADTSQAERALDRLADDAEGNFSTQGETVGQAFMGGLLGGLASTPVVGIVTGLAQDMVDGFTSGFDVEVRADRLAATAGLDPETTARLGRAAGEAYADNWGDSVDANFDTARLAVQTSLLDPAATKRDAQAIIGELAGVSSLIEEETARVARTSAQLIKTGIATDADAAFDIIVKGQQAGLNASEDWLDTLDEYSTKFRDLGLTGPQTLGLLRQAVQAGARDTDTAADALKEFVIRAIDGSDTTIDGFERLGLSVTGMQADVAAGGTRASDALGRTLDALRQIEDPATRDAIAVELFGTKAEDMGDALYAMDLSNAVDQLGAVEGAAESALATLSDNTRNDLDTAKRQIEIAAEGIQGALAAAFAPQIEGAAEFVTENREGVLQFLLDIANGALDIGRGFVEGTAAGGEAIGSFIAGPAASLVETLAGIADGMSFAGFGVPGAQEAAGDLRALAENMRGADEAAQAAGDAIRDRLITNGIDVAQAKLNEFGDGMLADARLHDRTYALAKDIDAVGIAADGAKGEVHDLFTPEGGINFNTEAGKDLAAQIIAVRDAMEGQAEASALAGESADEMNAALDTAYQSLVDQLEELGLTEEQARNLADAFGLIPTDVTTSVTVEAAQAEATLARLREALNMPGQAVITAEMRAEGGYYANRALGGIDVKAMALGGVLTPIAQHVPPGTMRVVGDRLDVDEAFIPLDGSPRSIQILLEAMQRMPNFRGMAAGGITGAPTVIPQSVTNYREAPINVEHFHGTVSDLEREMRDRENSTGGHRG